MLSDIFLLSFDGEMILILEFVTDKHRSSDGVGADEIKTD